MLQFKVVKTAGNDRTRCSLSSRKPIDAATANLPHKTTFFAKTWAEFGNAWAEERNDYEEPTPRQVFAGLE